MDSDLREPGTTAQMIVDHLRGLPGLSSVIRYMIYNHKMYHSRDDFRPTAYTGASGHEEHIHFEGAWSQAADNNTTFDFKFDEVGRPADKGDTMSAEDARQGFADALAEMATVTDTGTANDSKWGAQVNANFRRVVVAAVSQSPLAADVKALSAKLDALNAKLDALNAK